MLQIDLLNSENLRVAIAQLCNDVTGLQVHYIIACPKVAEYHINTKFSKCNSFQVTTDLLNS